MNFRISADSLDFYVDVRLRNFDGRWLAVASISGDLELGLGRTASEALAASLSCLGTATSAALMTDPQVLRIGQHAR